MSPRRKCDVVMQGGVTSGVVYPGLITKLAEQYDFQNIGGTSAGAIAASLTAAAEYARRRSTNPNPNAFTALNEIATWLGTNSKHVKGSNLFALFQPQPAMTGLFKLALFALIEGKIKKTIAFLTLFWCEILVGIAPGVILGVLAGASFHGWGLLLLLLTAFAATTGFLFVGVLGIALRLFRLPKNFFGLCTGHAEPSGNGAPALVPWLHEQINTIAGKPLDQPLTFGDLEDKEIHLRMMTTCVTLQRPFTLPFTTHEFYFSPVEFRRYFPEEVVRWLENNPPTPKTPDQRCHTEKKDHADLPIDTTGLRQLPDLRDLPVVVATRFSLSFPLLFCTVPLYAVDFSLRVCDEDEKPPYPPVPGGPVPHHGPRRPELVWFTDGGICNNFPLHLFDAPLPRWPTFGVDLTDIRADRRQPDPLEPDPLDPDPKKDQRAWMPRHNTGGIQGNWTRLSTQSFKGNIDLVVGIINSARNWVNSLQAAAPGYRDRIVHIALTKDEGGLNLIMPLERVQDLNRYGSEAGELLIDHFINGTDDGKNTGMTWDNQRWIRFRSTISLLEQFMKDFVVGVNHPEPGDRTYLQLIQRGPSDPPSSYRLVAGQLEAALAETEALVQLGKQMDSAELTHCAPKPEPRLVIRPDF